MLDPTFCTQKSTKCWITSFSPNFALISQRAQFCEKILIQLFVHKKVQNVGSNILYTKKYKMLDHQFFAQFRLDITKSTILRKNPDPTFCTHKSTKCWIQLFVHKKVQNVGSPVFRKIVLFVIS